MDDFVGPGFQWGRQGTVHNKYLWNRKRDLIWYQCWDCGLDGIFREDEHTVVCPNCEGAMLGVFRDEDTGDWIGFDNE